MNACGMVAYYDLSSTRADELARKIIMYKYYNIYVCRGRLFQMPVYAIEVYSYGGYLFFAK